MSKFEVTFDQFDRFAKATDRTLPKENSPKDGSAWEAGNNGNCDVRVLRGGSWYYKPEDVRSADRNRYRPAAVDDDVGFRLWRAGPISSN